MTNNTDINLNGLNSYSDFEKLRKANPEIYWKGSTQALLHRKAGELGDKFFQEPTQPRNPETGQFTKQERIQSLREQLEELEGDSSNE